MRRDRMRTFAWVLIWAGPVFAVGYAAMAILETRQNVSQWIKMEGDSLSMDRISRVGEMITHGLAPAWTQVSPAPGIAIGLGMAAFGVLLLAIRRPAPLTIGDDDQPRARRIASLKAKIADLKAKIHRPAFLPTKPKPPVVPKGKAQIRPPWEKDPDA